MRPRVAPCQKPVWNHRREQRECRREIARARAGYRDYDRRDDRWRDRRDYRDRRY